MLQAVRFRLCPDDRGATSSRASTNWYIATVASCWPSPSGIYSFCSTPPSRPSSVAQSASTSTCSRPEPSPTGLRRISAASRRWTAGSTPWEQFWPWVPCCLAELNCRRGSDDKRSGLRRQPLQESSSFCYLRSSSLCSTFTSTTGQESTTSFHTVYAGLVSLSIRLL